MKTIVFAATKGGTGKTTLTFNVAIEASLAGPILIADMDPQRSLKTMWERRGNLSNPRLVSNVQSLGQSIRLLKEAGYEREYMIVDTPGSMMPVIRDAISAADLIVLPIQPSPMDWQAQEAVADLVAELGVSDRAMFVVNRAEGKSDMVERAVEFFSMRTRFPIPIIKQRADYARGVETGKAAFEVSGNKDAKKEVRDLWSLIRKSLHETTARESENDRAKLH